MLACRHKMCEGGDVMKTYKDTLPDDKNVAYDDTLKKTRIGGRTYEIKISASLRDEWESVDLWIDGDAVIKNDGINIIEAAIPAEIEEIIEENDLYPRHHGWQNLAKLRAAHAWKNEATEAMPGPYKIIEIIHISGPEMCVREMIEDELLDDVYEFETITEAKKFVADLEAPPVILNHNEYAAREYVIVPSRLSTKNDSTRT